MKVFLVTSIFQNQKRMHQCIVSFAHKSNWNENWLKNFLRKKHVWIHFVYYVCIEYTLMHWDRFALVLNINDIDSYTQQQEYTADRRSLANIFFKFILSTLQFLARFNFLCSCSVYILCTFADLKSRELNFTLNQNILSW